MQDPEPAKPSGWAKWKPHQSVVGGGLVGSFIATLVIKLIEYHFHTTLDDTTSEAITGLCFVGATYFIPDSSTRP